MDMPLPTPLGPRLRADWREGVERLRVLPRRSWKAVGVSLIALLFGTFKEENGLRHFFEQRDWLGYSVITLAIFLWLGWLVAAVGEFFGSEIFSMVRGDLVVSRGMGPLRRTWRYRGRDIAELVSPFADEDAKPHVHNIFLRSKKGGAVRFEYLDKEVYFAETLSEAEGEAVVAWLRRRLPRSAGEIVNSGI